jgi:hypothetical protein
MRVTKSLCSLWLGLTLVVLTGGGACEDELEPPTQTTQAGRGGAGSGGASGAGVGVGGSKCEPRCNADCPAELPSIGASCGSPRSCQYPSLSFGVECRNANSIGNTWEYARADTTPVCPAEQPVEGSPCPGQQQCQYASRLEFCLSEPRIDAECSADTHTWRSWHSICGQASDLKRCDPRGEWTLVLTEQSGASCIQDTDVLHFGVRARANGELQVVGTDSSGITDDGCSLTFTTEWKKANYSENWRATQELTLKFEGDELRGTYHTVAGGFCSGEATGNVIGTRVSVGSGS